MASVEEYTRYLKEHGQQSTLDELGRTGGGIQQAAAQWGGPSSSQSSTSGYSPTQVQNPVDIAKQMYELANQFRQPAISTLQAQQPGITSAYQGLSTAAAGQKPTIEQRYKDTLAEITKTTRGAAAGEFTQRGIPLSSNLVEQTVGSRLAPQIASAATQRDTNLLGVDQLLADIGMGQQTSQTSLAQAIAAIQAGASGEAISSAQNIYGQQEQSRQAGLSNSLEQQKIDFAKQQYQNEWPYQQKTYEYNLNKPYSSGGDGNIIVEPINQQGIQTTFGNPPAYTPSKGAGSFSSDNKWYFDGKEWLPAID